MAASSASTAPFASAVPTAMVSDEAAILQNITQEDCNLAIWQRPVPFDVTPLMIGAPKDIRCEATRATLPTVLRGALREAGFAASHLHDAFVADAVLLADHFCAALRLARFEVRLEVVTTDSCRKFHADYVTARLITTYVGPGTDWLDADGANAVAQGAQPARINRMKAGDVGLFKGRHASLHPAIHRSPPISQSGERRLLMVLNPVSAHAG
ncbi:MAG: DUF1826 domain-containing protein [Porphyrobacter sp.]|jgi:hypothetical protein|nr:DUF1826 domain-containing protein [Porphyrobacter sp.]